MCSVANQSFTEKSNLKSWGQFHKAKMPKFVLQYAKIFKALSIFNFIKECRV